MKGESPKGSGAAHHLRTKGTMTSEYLFREALKAHIREWEETCRYNIDYNYENNWGPFHIQEELDDEAVKLMRHIERMWLFIGEDDIEDMVLSVQEVQKRLEDYIFDELFPF